MARCNWPALLVLGIVFLTPVAGEAAIVTWDASSGLYPDSVGWTYNITGTPPIVTIGAGKMTLISLPGNNRAEVLYDLYAAGTPSGSGIFMESTVKVISETHTTADLGLTILEVQDVDASRDSEVDIYAQTGRVNIRGNFGTNIGHYDMDTTDAFHTYRVELLGSRMWLFVDGSLVLTTNEATLPGGAPILRALWGDSRNNSSYSTAEWTRITIGSLADIGGPTVPEPGSLALFGMGIVGIGIGAARRRLEMIANSSRPDS